MKTNLLSSVYIFDYYKQTPVFMKRFAFCLSLLVALLMGCDQTTDLNAPSLVPIRSISSVIPDSEPQLRDKIKSVLSQATNARSDFFERIRWESAIKVADGPRNTTRYSFFYADEAENMGGFTNFVLNEKHGKLEGYLLRYIPDKGQTQSEKFNLSTFTGTILGLNLAGEIISKCSAKDGKVTREMAVSGRTQNDIPEFPNQAGCYELVYSTATGMYFWQSMTCGGGDSSGGTVWNPSTNSWTGSGTPPTSSGYNNGSGNNTGNGGGAGGTNPPGFEDTPTGVIPIPYPETRSMLPRFEREVTHKVFDLITINFKNSEPNLEILEQALQIYGEGANLIDNVAADPLSYSPGHPYSYPFSIYLVGYNITIIDSDGTTVVASRDSYSNPTYIERRSTNLEYEAAGHGAPYYMHSFTAGSKIVKIYVIYHTHDRFN